MSASITRSPKLEVIPGGTGEGSVTSEPGGISCPNDCSQLFTFNSSVTLTPHPGAESLFTGWSACAGTGWCTVAMAGDRSVIATFDYVKPARIEGTPPSYYDGIGEAYGHLPVGGGTIRSREFVFTEEILLNRGIAFAINGGYDILYSANSGYSTIKGSLTVESGSLTVGNFVIR